MSSNVETAKPRFVRFLCCIKTIERIRNYGQAGLAGDKSARPFYIDGEGFLICPEHGLRRFGWLSPRQTEFPSVPQDLDKPRQTVLRTNHSETHIERDKAIRSELGL